MKTELKPLILSKIKTKSLKAFSCYDFTEFAPYKTISKCLERMEDSSEITRIIQGVYCLSKIDKVLNLPILPTIDDVVQCIARKHKWIICPSGNLALNLMGLSTQVPASYIYLSNGPYSEYLVYGIKVLFKRTMNREITNYSYKTMLLIQCIKSLGEETEKTTLIKLRNKLSSKEKQKALKETSAIQSWIRNKIILICKEEQ